MKMSILFYTEIKEFMKSRRILVLFEVASAPQKVCFINHCQNQYFTVNQSQVHN